MTPKQREAAERLMEQMGNDHRGYDPDFNEAAAILRELLAGTDAENATVEPVQEPGIEYKRGYEEALNDCIRNGLIWARSMFANNAEHIKPVQTPVVLDLLEQSRQNCLRNFGPNGLADWIYNDLSELLANAAPQQPMHCPKDGGECGAGGYCRPEPQQRKPLSDEQVRQIVVDASTSWAFKRDGSTSMRIARAIERAHGIGEPT